MGRHGVLGVCVVCLAAGAVWLLPASAGEKTTRPASGPSEWKVPLKHYDYLAGLSAGAEGRLVCLSGVHAPPPIKSAPPPGGPFCWLLDTTSGKTTDVMKHLADKAKIKGQSVEPAIPSPDGKHLALVAMTDTGRPPSKILAYVVDLTSGAVRKLYEGSGVQMAWCGPHLMVCTGDAKGQIEALKRVDPATGKAEALKVHCFLGGADPKGTYLVCGCLPDALDKPFTLPELGSKGALALLSPGGKILRKVAPLSELSRMPVISRGGKYLAFGREKSENPRRPPKPLGFRVISADGKVSRDVPGHLDPVGVTDAGDVIARVVPTRPDAKPAIKWFGADGKQRTLVPDARSAAVCGSRLFYVTAGKQPMLKCIPLK